MISFILAKTDWTKFHESKEQDKLLIVLGEDTGLIFDRKFAELKIESTTFSEMKDEGKDSERECALVIERKGFFLASI